MAYWTLPHSECAGHHMSATVANPAPQLSSEYGYETHYRCQFCMIILFFVVNIMLCSRVADGGPQLLPAGTPIKAWHTHCPQVRKEVL